MSVAFKDLSREGKLSKIEMHLDGAHPVPSLWVAWLVEEFVPTGHWPTDPAVVESAFHDLDDDRKMEKIAGSLHEGSIPSPWVKWLCDEFVPKREVAPAMKIG